MGPSPSPGPYGCLIEHSTLLIELTALSLGPFPLPHPHGTPVPSHRGLLVAAGSEGSEGGVVETVHRTCLFLLAERGWKCELGATKGLRLHRTGEFLQGRAGAENKHLQKQIQSLMWFSSIHLSYECSITSKSPAFIRKKVFRSFMDTLKVLLLLGC